MSDTPASSSSISASLQMARALALARKGKFQEAEATLVPDKNQSPEPVLLHAQAALVTSAGDYSRALQLWKSLLESEPRHAEAKRMIASIELWLSRPSWMRFVPLAGLLAGALILFLGLLWALSDSSPNPAAKRPITPAASHSPVSPVSPARR
jgi:hypothetical protein